MVSEVIPAPPRLKVTVDETGEVWIRGDEVGLRYLADWCNRIIGRYDASAHVLLQWQMNNLWPGSRSTVLEFRDDDAAYDD
jgi:hypothetical protein